MLFSKLVELFNSDFLLVESYDTSYPVERQIILDPFEDAACLLLIREHSVCK